MAYPDKHNWHDRAPPLLNAERLNEMEDGIDNAHKAIDNVITGHHHDGTDSKKVSHVDLLAKGTNTHSVIDAKIVESDAHIAAANPHSGSASDANLSAHTDATNPHSESAKSGANSDITQLSGLTTDLSIAQGGTGQSTASAAFDALKQSATETYAGVTERATAAEDVTGTATDVATTPAGLTERLKSPGEIGGTAPAAAKFTSVDSPYVTPVKEENTSNIARGQVICITGAVGGMVEVGLADCDDVDKMRVLGLAFANITQNNPGIGQTHGTLTTVDTRSTNVDINPNAETWAAGDMLYLDNIGGGMTNVRPTSGRIVKIARTLSGSAVNDGLYILGIKENPVWATAAAGEDVVLRVGDVIGVNKVSIRDYTDNEVASINSDGMGQIRGNVCLPKTDDYSVQITDFGKTIRVNSAIDKTMSLPSVGATEDGARITFIKLGAGRVTIAAADTDKFFDGSAGGNVYNDVAAEIGASVTIEYVDAITMWTFVSANGTWIIT